MKMDLIKENICEIALQLGYWEGQGKISLDRKNGSRQLNEEIVMLAKEFENKYRGTEKYLSNYPELMQEFLKEKYLKKEVN